MFKNNNKMSFFIIIVLIITGIFLYIKNKANNQYQILPDNSGSSLTDTSWVKNKYLNIPYASSSNAQKLDIYLPNDKSFAKPYPAIIAIHGGAFLGGDKADYQIKPMLEGIKHGYAVVSVNYRLANEAKFPAQIQDIKAAIRFIKANANKYNLNPNAIAVWGDSAGANLAALAATSGNKITKLDDLSLGNKDYSANVQACVDWFGPTDFSKMDDQFRQSGLGKPIHSQNNSPESLYIGSNVGNSPQKVKMADPETYISKDTPPFLIEHGSVDNVVPAQQSINFYKKLVKTIGKDKVELVIIDGAKHGGEKFESKSNLELVFKFLDKYLK
ncbi:alpha/beta hydrolase [Francisella sp. TX07-6608]|uniref:alpha/beta hydrolase n=1 Tax=Francisella sp. TX07-6608 TaxID=573568 RepID=UPI0008F9C9AC|nr:alpha/beta hydrolase [Francisella sp. TX07-6608]OIN84243.1 alpha/beta hydrolase fold family protein [Francisella sp. TX07-6608]